MQGIRNVKATCYKATKQPKMQDASERQGTAVQNSKGIMGKIFARRNTMKDKTTTDIILDVLIGALVPLAVAGIWFLTNIKWWA